MGKHKIIKSAAAVALTASVVATAAPGASAASYKTNAKDQLVHTSTGKLVKGWKVFGGKLYKNGKLAPAKKYKIIGTGAAQKLFYGPTLKKGYKTANSKTLLFKDGKLTDGWKQAGKNERLYKNGKLDKGYTVFTNVEGDKFLYQNGYLKKGQKTANRGGETLLFVDGKLAKGYVLHEASKTLFNNGKVAEGLVKYPETDGKFYNDGKLADGEINGVTYKDGVIVAKDVASVKAINDTTVEVTFKEAQKAENIKAADFKIEGLTVSNAALKQTDSKVVVLTTSKQEAAKEYVITYKENDTKTFVGFNAAIPTAIKSTEVKPYQTSQQAKIGEQVTVKATVTVAEGANKAGIPVTFVVDNNKDTASGNNANQGKDQTVEVLTDENGVASYTYTQYAASTDTVTAYPTGAPTQRATTNVYWGVAQPLTVTEVTEGTSLANNAKKVYKVTAPGYSKVKVTFAENYNVTPEKVNRDAEVNGTVPFQTVVAGSTSSQEAVEVTLVNGEATFTVTGANTSVTPVVYVDSNDNNRLNPTELQTTAAAVKFENAKTVGLTNEAIGTQKASASAKAIGASDYATSFGGRQFEATLTDKDGKTAAVDTPVYLTFSDEADKKATLKGKLHVFDANGVQVSADAKGVYKLYTNKDGKVSYTVSSDEKNNYATPVVFLENGSKGSATAPELDPADSQATAEITYFGDATVTKATLTFKDAKGNEITSIKGVNNVDLEYQTVDQNGLPYAPAKATNVTFNFDTTFGELTINGSKVATGNTGNGTYTATTTADGLVALKVSTTNDTKVNVSASGTTTIIDNVKGSFEFTGLSYLTKLATVENKLAELTFTTKAVITNSNDLADAKNQVSAVEAAIAAAKTAGAPDSEIAAVANYEKLAQQKAAIAAVEADNAATSKAQKLQDANNLTTTLTATPGTLASATAVTTARANLKAAKDAVKAAVEAGYTTADITDYAYIAAHEDAIKAATEVTAAANGLESLDLTATSPLEKITLVGDQAITGSLNLAKEGLVIEGNGKTVTSSGGTYGFVITGKNVTVKNANFVDANANSIYVQETGATITGNTFANGGVNIFEKGANSITLTGNTFKDMSVGIVIVEDAAPNNISYALSTTALKGFYNGNTFTLNVNNKFNGKVAVAAASDSANNFYYINDQGEVATTATKVVTLP